jgi:hypothetical protein
MAGGVDEASVADDGFALSGFPEFVRSGDGFWGDASRELDAEELTDIEVADVAAALRRAASWALVMHTGLGSFALSVTSLTISIGSPDPGRLRTDRQTTQGGRVKNLLTMQRG